jgi:hypothetical protein
MTRPAITMIAVTALVIGLMPTLHGPAASAEGGKATAAAQPDHNPPSENDAKKMPLPAAATRADAEGIDLSFIPATANAFMVARPAAVREHLAQTPWAKWWESAIGASGIRKGDFRQVAAIGVHWSARDHEPKRFALGCDSIIAHSLRPLEAAPLLRLATDCLVPSQSQVAVKDYDGRKLYKFIQKKNGPNAGAVLCYDDRTSIFLSSEKSVPACVSSKCGALPTWLPAKVWEEFRGDDLVMALDGSVIQGGWKLWKKGWSAEYAAYLQLAPLCEDSRFILAGVGFGDPVRVHAVATARDERSAVEVEKAAEALRRLGLKAIQEERAASAKGKTKADLDEIWDATFWEQVLAAMRFRREGVVIYMESSVPMAAFRDLALSPGVAPEMSRKPAPHSDDHHDQR